MTSDPRNPAAWLAPPLDLVLNRALRADPDALARLEPLVGKSLAITLTGLGATLYLIADGSGLRVRDHAEAAPPVTISGTPSALLRSLRGATDGITIEGDVHLAREFQAILRDLDIDAEELLAQRLGDPLAHRLGLLARGASGFGSQLLSTLFVNTGEYLQEERRELPPRSTVDTFLNDVDTLRSDIDRLEARITRLRRLLDHD